MTTDRIAGRFAGRRSQDVAALIFYVAAGDPTMDLSAPLLHALVAGGADIIELGYPFSDPILDGPVIRLANRRALDAGGSFDATLAIVREFRRDDPDTPIVLMGYANPVISRGPDLLDRIAGAGVDALIVPDMPLREAIAVLPALRAAGISFIPLVPPDGLADAAMIATPGVGGFLYCIAQAGPTGGAAPVVGDVTAAVAGCRTLSALPVAVGFGIKTPDLAAALAPHADAVIVGSALVAFIQDRYREDGSRDALLAAVTRYAAAFRTAIDASRR